MLYIHCCYLFYFCIGRCWTYCCCNNEAHRGGHCTCPVEEGLINHVRAERWQKQDFYHTWSAGDVTCSLNVQIWSNLWRQSYSTLMCSYCKICPKSTCILLSRNRRCLKKYCWLPSSSQWNLPVTAMKQECGANIDASGTTWYKNITVAETIREI